MKHPPRTRSCPIRRSFARAAALALCTLATANAQPTAARPPAAAKPLIDKPLPLTLDLGARRTNWNRCAWHIVELPADRSLADLPYLQLTATIDKPADALWLDVALREKDGSWYIHPQACDLANPTNTAELRTADFVSAAWTSPPAGGPFADQNARLDLDQVDAIAIGMVNPFGPGKVQLTITRLEAHPGPATVPPAQPLEAVILRLNGDLLDVNGTDTVSAGVFGAFNLKSIKINDQTLSRANHFRLAQDRYIDHEGLGRTPRHGDDITWMFINTLGDRIRPSHRLTRPTWKQDHAASGEAYARAAAEAAKRGQPTYVEFWNEPYLNWANRNRANFIPRFFDESKATEGGPVHILHDGALAPHLKWTRNHAAPPWNWATPAEWRRGRDESGRQISAHAMPYANQQGMAALYGGPWLPQTHPPADVPDGKTYTAKVGGKDVTLTAFTPWHIYDETQFTYWSGKGMLKFYLDPLLAFAEPFKKHWPDGVVIAGWGFRPSEDHWAAWDLLYRPTIDAAIHVIDGICDHDYGADPVKMSGNYEVITAYSVTAHNKWLYGFNTECASATDPQAIAAAADLASQPQNAADQLKFRWFTAKVLHALQTVPDKARSMSHFGLGGSYWSDTGEGTAATLLMPLRGRLLHLTLTDARNNAIHPHSLFAVASIDGTDPRNPRPAAMSAQPEVAIALFNHADQPVTINPRIDLGPAIRHGPWTLHTAPTQPGEPNLPLPPKTLGQTLTQPIQLDPGQLVVLRASVTDLDLPKAPVLQRRQYFSNAVLAPFSRSKPLRQTIQLPADALNNPTAMRLRMVLENVRPATMSVRLAGIDLGNAVHAVSNHNSPVIRDIELTPDQIQTLIQTARQSNNTLELHLDSTAHAPARLCTASLFVDHRLPPGRKPAPVEGLSAAR